MREDDLDDEAFVIRFGVMKLEDVKEAIDRCFSTLGFYGLSFYGENRLTVAEISALAKKPHTQIRKTKVGLLRSIGFDVRRRGRFPHLTMAFPDKPTDRQLKVLIGVFDDPEPNPHPVE